MTSAETTKCDGIHGPKKVLEVEINAALTWTETVSCDGVVSQTAKLRKPVLIERALVKR
jgi:hypothetical protein